MSSLFLLEGFKSPISIFKVNVSKNLFFSVTEKKFDILCLVTGKWWGPRTGQPIIAIHGWLDNCGSFDNLAPLLVKKGLSLFCYDLPGHGFSSHLPKGQNYYLFWDGVHCLRRIVKHFNWSKITIIGHSLGGCIAFLYAASYQNDVKGYVSLDIAGPCSRDPPESVLDDFGTSLDKILEFEETVEWPSYTHEQIISVCLAAFNGNVDRKGCEILLRRGMRKPGRREGFILSRDPRVKESAQEFMTINQALGLASRITCEVLNIQAGIPLPSIQPEYYSMILDEIEKNAKKLERHLIPGTGHHLHLMDAHKVAPIIIQFLLA